MSGPTIITVFLASTEDELVEDRTGIGDFFNELNNIYLQRGVYLKPIKWEPDRQDECQQHIRDSALCFFLFFTRLRQHTVEPDLGQISAHRQLG